MLLRSLKKFLPWRTSRRNLRLVHVGLFFKKGNAGDLVMRRAVKVFFKRHVAAFTELNTRQEVNDGVINAINASDGLLIGGGGLFWNNPRLNYSSGWQWNIRTRNIARIHVPICFYAVGDSSFYGEAIDSANFRENFGALLRKDNLLVGFRNKGSYENVRKVFGASVDDVSFYQPCPTTFLAHYYRRLNALSKRPATRRQGKPIVSVNLPFDKKEQRYSSERQIDALASALKAVSSMVHIKIACHIEGDIAFMPYLERAGIDAEIVHLNQSDANQIIDYYKDVDLSVGGRAHAIKIPFGLGKPVIGVSTHNKIAWFFADLNGDLPCIDANGQDAPQGLSRAIEEVIAGYAAYAQTVFAHNWRLYNLSVQNRDLIAREFFTKQTLPSKLELSRF